MRAILGIIAGITLGSIIAPGTTQETILGLVFVIGILFYIISYIAAKKIALNEIIEKRKFITNGMFPYMFLLLLFMIMMYTGLHQSLAV